MADREEDYRDYPELGTTFRWPTATPAEEAAPRHGARPPEAPGALPPELAAQPAGMAQPAAAGPGEEPPGWAAPADAGMPGQAPEPSQPPPPRQAPERGHDSPPPRRGAERGGALAPGPAFSGGGRHALGGRLGAASQAAPPLRPPPGFGAVHSPASAGSRPDLDATAIEETFDDSGEAEWDDGVLMWDAEEEAAASGAEAERGRADSPDDWEARAQAWAEGGDWADTGSDDNLTADLLLRRRREAPQAGWRRAVYQASGGLLRPSPSAAQRRDRDLALRARTAVAGGHHRVAVLSLKGGVGKTTVVMGLGLTLASLRGDRVIALDANPDRGTLCDKLRLETAATVRDLVAERDRILRYADVRAYTTQAAGQLEVLASDRDPTVSVAFSEEDYRDAARVLERFYSICVTDCGTGLLHSAMAGVLDLADQIVVVSTGSVDAARGASATLDWLAAHQHADLVRGAVVALTMLHRRGSAAVDLERLEEHFAARCRSVVRIPWDAHLHEGAEVDLDAVGKATAEAFLELAAEVGDGFAWPRRRQA